MLRRWWPLLLILFLLVLRRPLGQTDMTPLALRVAERYGTTNLKYITTGEQRRLELTITGKRGHKLNDGLPDSARAVARYALADLQGFPRPDTITVTFASSRWFGMVSGATGVHLATAEL